MMPKPGPPTARRSRSRRKAARRPQPSAPTCSAVANSRPGTPQYDARLAPAQRRHFPLDNATPERLAAAGHLALVAEQGLGDQLALLRLLSAIPRPEGQAVTLIGEARMAPLLAGNRLGLHHGTTRALGDEAGPLAGALKIYLGDLTRFIRAHPAAHTASGAPEPGQGAYLVADPARVATLSARYAALAQGRPTVGLAWASRSVRGLARTLPPEVLARSLPEGALAVSLQYGLRDEEIAALRRARPDLLVQVDDDIDQIADPAGLAAQIMALEQVVTIDNTTAHLCGALGHRQTHMLLPRGAGCMWYWRGEGAEDPWYGALHLHRQQATGDWTAPLQSVRRALTGQ